MAPVGSPGLRPLFHFGLGLVLIGSLDLSIGQQAEGSAPFFNDSGSLTLPPDSIVDMQESMPENKLYPTPGAAQMLPPLGSPLTAPDL